MSMQELAQIMREAGLKTSDFAGTGGSGSNGVDRINVVHALDISEKWDKLVDRFAAAILLGMRDLLRCSRIVACGVSGALLLWGVGQVIRAIQSPPSRPPGAPDR